MYLQEVMKMLMKMKLKKKLKIATGANFDANIKKEDKKKVDIQEVKQNISTSSQSKEIKKQDLGIIDKEKSEKFWEKNQEEKKVQESTKIEVNNISKGKEVFLEGKKRRKSY